MASFKEICLKNGTDKGQHIVNNKEETYADIYQKYFENIRYNNNKILELGVKTGKSLLALKEYFPNSIIYGLDIDPDCILYNDPNNNIFVEIISQIDEEKLNNFILDKKFDIILDDASHVNKYSVKSFDILHPSLNPNGLYIIEDLGCGYLNIESDQKVSQIWPGMKYNINHDFDNNINYIHNFTNTIIESIDLGVTRVRDQAFDYNSILMNNPFLRGEFSFVHRYKFILIIGKN